MVGARCIGSVDDEYFCHLWRSQRAAFSPLLLRTEDCGVPAWHLQGEATFALEHIATALKQIESSGVASLWRNELLDVRDCDELPVGQIERGAVRALGISTRAVHLVGCDDQKRLWIQQRSLTKSTDPGLWDTLMGGMISARDTLESALERETWEEAGIGLKALMNVRWGGYVVLNMPHANDGGIGYVNERIDWFQCEVPAGVQPVNLDGEVERFARVDQSELRAMLEGNAFTSEAALIMVQYLRGL